MTKKNFIRFIQTSLLGAAIAVALPACTDDHFDVAGGGEGGNATKTLWEQLESRPELSHFADIVRQTPYFKDEAHPSKDYTYKDVLNGTQVFTVFAPTNEAFDDAAYNDALELLKTDPYDVYLRIVGNQIALHRYVATGTGKEELVTINSKRATFDRAGKTFKDLPLSKANIEATNGTLHMMSTMAPFAYNIYEYIKAHGSQFGELKKWITEHDTIYFSADNSVEGGSDRDGNPIYVDSVYFRTNTLFNLVDYEKPNQDWLIPHKAFKANIEAEDSVWAMALPTDAAWTAAATALAPNYVYSGLYINKEREDIGATGETLAGEGAESDSLQKLSIRMDLASGLLFNVRIQPRKGEDRSFWKAETFQAAEFPKMFNTRIDTFTYDKDALQDVKSLLFDGNTSPIAVSNGLVYPVNNWRFFEPYGATDLDIEITDRSIFHYTNLGTTTVEYVAFNNSTSDLSKDYGSVYKDRFYYISNGTSAPNVSIKLLDTEHNRQVMSNVEYEIGFVMVPDFYRANPDSIISTDPSRSAIQKNKLRAQITYNNGVTSRGAVEEKRSSNFDFEYDGFKVDTIWTDAEGKAMTFTFPKSYKNISKSYPTLNLTSRSRSSDLRDDYQHPFSIDRIILRAKK